MNSNGRKALVVTAVTGVALAAVSIYENQFGASDATKTLSFILLVGVMLGGVGIAYFMSKD